MDIDTNDINSSLAPSIHVAPSPHVFNAGMTTRTMMRDVLIALLPVVVAALYLFRWGALKQLLICTIACLAAEALFTRMRRRTLKLKDLSATVTGGDPGLVPPGHGALVCGVHRRGHRHGHR